MRQLFGILMPIEDSVLRGSLRKSRYSAGVHSQKWSAKGSAAMIFERADRSTTLDGIGWLPGRIRLGVKGLKINAASVGPRAHATGRQVSRQPQRGPSGCRNLHKQIRRR